jgi:hypothetical protein
MFTKSNNVTDFLFATPSFLTGAGTVMNLAGSSYQFNVSSTSDEADCLAIKNDFYIIGNDLKKAISNSINSKALAK